MLSLQLSFILNVISPKFLASSKAFRNFSFKTFIITKLYQLHRVIVRWLATSKLSCFKKIIYALQWFTNISVGASQRISITHLGRALQDIRTSAFPKDSIPLP